MSAVRAVRPSVRGYAADVGIVAALTAVAAVAYVWTRAPLYNPRGTIDPWLYTALWTNFDQIYHYFAGTYYVSRLPWIIPGAVVNGLWGFKVAYWSVHVTFFFAGAVGFYVACRRWMGRAGAAAGYVAVIANQLYFSAHRWDYEEGGSLTYMILTVACCTPRARRQPLRAASLAAAGFFAAATVTTRAVEAAFLAFGLPLLYWATQTGRRFLMPDLMAFAVGAAALLVACGTFAQIHGAEFLFFMPQLRTIFAGTAEVSQQPVGLWFPRTPYLFFPPFIAVVGGVVALRALAFTASSRVLIATSAWTALVFSVFALWEFAGKGFLLEYSWYFSSFLVPSCMCLASVVAVLIDGASRAARVAAVSAVAAGTLVPLAWVYRTDSPSRIADGIGYQQHETVAVLMTCGLVLALLWWWRRSVVLAIATAAAAAAGIAYATDASSGTFVVGTSDRSTGDLYVLAQRVKSDLRAHGYADRMPLFWYDQRANRGVYVAIQSLYYFSYTYVGIAMPKVDSDFRSRLRVYRPDELVLLCERRACANGREALVKERLRPRLVRAEPLRADHDQVWVVTYAIHQPSLAST